jgi:hypothetical protein
MALKIDSLHDVDDASYVTSTDYSAAYVYSQTHMTTTVAYGGDNDEADSDDDTFDDNDVKVSVP